VVVTDTTNLSRQVETQTIPEKINIIPNKELENNLTWTKSVHTRQIFVDISELVNRDAKTGIQRVVRSILSELIENPPAGFTIEPVYATSENGYRYARQFTWRFSELPVTNLTDAPLKVRKGDIFLGLDLQPYLVPQQVEFYSYLKLLGAEVYFIVYDLLPILTPKNFPEGTADVYSEWLRTIAQGDGAICISRAVADELSSWLSAYGPKRNKPFKLGWFHLGGDVLNSVPSTGIPSNAEEILSILAKRPTFLVVGTLEPRKCHTQVLSAFEELWKSGQDVNLVIVGKKGWLVDSLTDRILKHNEKNSRLFWLDSISDEFLET
jgi:glycosyltransferase involved in cell wall biosynthesis